MTFQRKLSLDKLIYGNITKLLKFLKKNLERCYFHIHLLKSFIFYDFTCF